MRFTILDRNLKCVGHISDLGNARTQFGDYKLLRSISAGSASIEMDVYGDTSLLAMGRYIMRKNGDRWDFFTIVEGEDVLGVNKVYAEEAGLDLLNNTYDAGSLGRQMTLAEITDYFTRDSGFEVGINELGGFVRTLSWESEGTGLERMLSAANSFGSEMRFRFVFNGNRLEHKYIDFRRRFGNDIGIKLRVGYELEKLEVKKSIIDLVTGLKPTGSPPEGTETPIDLTKLSKGYDDGDIYTSGAYLFSRSARAKWNRYNSDYGGDGNLIRAWNYDTANVDELLNRSITHLKANMDEKKSYVAQISDSVKNIGLGDIVTAIDKSRDIRVRCRVTETEETTAGMSYTLEEVLA